MRLKAILLRRFVMSAGRSEARKPFQLTAAGYVVFNGKVLLVAHKQLRKWLPPGGHLMQDSEEMFIESPEEAAIREVKEETGLEVEMRGRKYHAHDSETEMLTVPESMHIHPIDAKHDHLGFDFFCVPKETEEKLKGEERCRWFSEDELKNYPSDAALGLPVHVRATAIKAIERSSKSIEHSE